ERNLELNKRIHPTQKPVGVFLEILKNYTENNQNILDLYGGSGTTLIACEQTNRKCFMMEIDPVYVSVILERWEKFTNKKAVKL
ncbi:MAG: DNA methyltransferase, partial [Nanoarchaeota archaeon]